MTNFIYRKIIWLINIAIVHSKNLCYNLLNLKGRGGEMEENLKKALSEMLVLALLHERDYYALELAPAIEERSNGAIAITFPYSILYRMIEQEYVQELPKQIAPDGRRRQYFGITETGRDYFRQIWATYQSFIAGVNQLVSNVLETEGGGVTK